MVQRKTEKFAALILFVMMLVISLEHSVSSDDGLHYDCSILDRAIYPFIHANVFHMIINGWCMLSIVFTFSPSWKRMLTAYLIAISYPAAFIGRETVVGLSGVCFALMGLNAYKVKRKKIFYTWTSACIALGFLFPNVAAGVHVFCFLVGLACDFLGRKLNVLS